MLCCVEGRVEKLETPQPFVADVVSSVTDTCIYLASWLCME